MGRKEPGIIEKHSGNFKDNGNDVFLKLSLVSITLLFFITYIYFISIPV